jgi:hypothetical protein
MCPDPFTRLLDRLVAAVEQDAELRASLSALARSVVARLDPVPPPVVVEPPPPPPEPAPEPPAPRPQLVWRDFDIPILPPPGLLPPPPAPTVERADRTPMPILAARCRVKADAARVLAGEAIDRPAVERKALSLPDCRLWMFFDPTPTQPAAVWRDLAGAYATLAEACDLIHTWDGLTAAAQSALAGEVLPLAAEAQSTLLSAVADTRAITGFDEEQLQVFLRLRDEAAERQVFIRKFLKRSDSADPANWPDVRRRVNELAAKVRAAGGDKKRQKAAKNLFRKLELMKADPSGQAGEWPRVYELIDQLAADGLPPTNADVRDHLLAVWEHLPADLPAPPGVGRVLAATERFLETRPAPAEPPAPEPPTAEVAAVARALAGREIVLIGGQARPTHVNNLKAAFGLADVRWLAPPEHSSYTLFEPDVARPEVAVVVLAIRWMSHDYDRVRGYCDRYGKPLVRLTGGYNPNQLAHQIVAQVGRKLGLTGD